MVGARFGKFSGFRGGDGHGEWSSVSGLVRMCSVDGGSLTFGGELAGSSGSIESMLSIS